MGGISYHGGTSVAAVPVDRVDAPFLVSQTDLRSQFSCLFRRKAVIVSAEAVSVKSIWTYLCSFSLQHSGGAITLWTYPQDSNQIRAALSTQPVHIQTKQPVHIQTERVINKKRQWQQPIFFSFKNGVFCWQK